MPTSTERDYIIAIVVISIVDVVLISILFYYWFCYRKRESAKKTKNTTAEGNTCPELPFPPGLPNLGNTCYFNSTIQCLASTPILRSQVLQTTVVKEVTREFLRFLSPIDPEIGSLSGQLDPKPLLTAFCAKVSKFRGTLQHDSHELLRHFLDQLRQEERASWTNVNPNKQLTAVDKVFGGHFMTVYICENCKTPYHICEPFLDISVPICVGDLTGAETLATRENQDTETYTMSPYQEAIESITHRLAEGSAHLPTEILSITDCLTYFTRQEMLGQQYMCNNCAYSSLRTSPNRHESNNLTRATKQTLVFNPPAVLVIHLKRFETKGRGFEKRSNLIKFEELLDLAPYCSSWCLRNEDRDQKIWYSLYGVVVHSGTLDRGHYIAYVKVRNETRDIERFLQKNYFDRDVTEDQLVDMMREFGQTGRRPIPNRAVASQGFWYCMNDARVSDVSFGEVLRKEAFLLFYERIPSVTTRMISNL